VPPACTPARPAAGSAATPAPAARHRRRTSDQGGRCGAGVAPDGELVQQRTRASRDLCAALLEIATRLGGSPPLTNAVRFGFWGSEEVDLNGSTEYVTACPTRNAGT
jgi:hypothetical protein